MFSDVVMSLRKISELRGMSVTEIKGFGRREDPDRHSAVDDLMDLAPHLRIEIFCGNDFVDDVVLIIDKAAYTREIKNSR